MGRPNFSAASLLTDQREKRSDSGCPVPAAALKAARIGSPTNSQLQPLVGKSSYEVTFPKGQIPPAKDFWSVTVYNPEHFFYPNALNCYALGPKNKTLKYNDDGSLTIYLGNQSPGKEKESNWLPAPDGNFLSGFGPIGPTRPSSTALGSQSSRS